ALGGRDITFRTAVARALVAIPLPPDGSAASLHAAAVDPALPADLRAQALAALARVPSALGAARTLDAHASVVPELSAQTEMRTVWRRFVTDRKHADEVESFGTMATTADP